jgi:hypothetical protein
MIVYISFIAEFRPFFLLAALEEGPTSVEGVGPTFGNHWESSLNDDPFLDATAMPPLMEQDDPGNSY